MMRMVIKLILNLEWRNNRLIILSFFTDDQLSVQYIKNYFDRFTHTKSVEGVKKTTPKPSIKTVDTKYKEGQG